MSASRYPLSWPAGWKRTASYARNRAPFRRRGGDLSVAAATDRLQGELDRLGAREAILSTNLALRLDGLPRSDQGRPNDPGVAVYFKLKGADRVLACDRYDRVEGNIAAIAAHIESLRAIDRYGVGTLDQAFAGYTALGAAAEVEWWLVLQVPRSAGWTSIDAAYKELAKKAHPDAGGSEAEMQRLNVARDAARLEKRP